MGRRSGRRCICLASAKAVCPSGLAASACLSRRRRATGTTARSGLAGRCLTIAAVCLRLTTDRFICLSIGRSRVSATAARSKVSVADSCRSGLAVCRAPGISRRRICGRGGATNRGRGRTCRSTGSPCRSSGTGVG